MRIDIRTDLDGIGAVLKKELGLPVEPTSVTMSGESLRVEGAIKVFGIGLKTVVLRARVDRSPGQLRLTDFEIDGAVLNVIALGMLRESVAGVDVGGNPSRVKGASDGRTLTVSWAT